MEIPSSPIPAESSDVKAQRGPARPAPSRPAPIAIPPASSRVMSAEPLSPQSPRSPRVGKAPMGDSKIPAEVVDHFDKELQAKGRKLLFFLTVSVHKEGKSERERTYKPCHSVEELNRVIGTYVKVKTPPELTFMSKEAVDAISPLQIAKWLDQGAGMRAQLDDKNRRPSWRDELAAKVHQAGLMGSPEVREAVSNAEFRRFASDQKKAESLEAYDACQTFMDALASDDPTLREAMLKPVKDCLVENDQRPAINISADLRRRLLAAGPGDDVGAIVATVQSEMAKMLEGTVHEWRKAMAGGLPARQAAEAARASPTREEESRLDALAAGASAEAPAKAVAAPSWEPRLRSGDRVRMSGNADLEGTIIGHFPNTPGMYRVRVNGPAGDAVLNVHEAAFLHLLP